MNEDKLSCRVGCGACCIAPSISSPIPGMPDGKPAGVRCIQLDAFNQCMIFGKQERPRVCESLQASTEMCGESREYALEPVQYLFGMHAAPETGRMLGAATRRSGATARSRNNVGDRFPGLPGGFEREGRIAALRRLHREPPCAARRALHCIPSRSNVHAKQILNRLQYLARLDQLTS